MDRESEGLPTSNPCEGRPCEHAQSPEEPPAILVSVGEKSRRQSVLSGKSLLSCGTAIALLLALGYWAEESGPRRQANQAVQLLLAGDRDLIRGRSKEALKSYRNALEITEKLHARFPQHPPYRLLLGFGHLGMAISQQHLGDSAQATVNYERAIEFGQELWRSQPQDIRTRVLLARAQRNRALLALASGNSAGALECYRMALELGGGRDGSSLGDELLAEMAHAHNGVAALYEDEQREEAAFEEYQKAAEIWRSLGGKYADNAELLIAHSQTCQQLAFIDYSQGRTEQALAGARRAIEQHSRLVELEPDQPEYQRLLAFSYVTLASLLEEIGSPGEAAPLADKAISLAKRCVDLNMRSAEDVENLTSARCVYARCQSALGNHASAIQQMRASISLLETLADGEPDNDGYRQSLATAYNELGLVEQAAKKLDEALQSHRTAADKFRDLLKRLPDDLDLRSNLGGATHNYGTVLQEQHRLDDAADAYNSALELQTYCFEREPQVAQHRRYLSNHLRSLAQVYLEWERPDRAAPLVEERQNLWQGNADELCACASDLARCAVEARRLEETGKRPGASESRSYAVMTVDALRKAIEAGFEDAERLVQLPEFAALQAFPAFQEFLRTLTPPE